MTAYIPTNLVSITDGQIRLHAGLAAAAQLPAIDVGLSVSRVGGRAQPPSVRKLAGALKNRYAQFLELEAFTRFGTRPETAAAAVVTWGTRVRQALRQPRGRALSWGETVARAALLDRPQLASVQEDDVVGWISETTRLIAAADRDGWNALEAGEPLEPDRLSAMMDVALNAEGSS